MTTPLYFQWQNDTLLKTIYPLRETKLRDSLVYFAEIGARYFSANVLKTVDESVRRRRRVDREIVIPVYAL